MNECSNKLSKRQACRLSVLGTLYWLKHVGFNDQDACQHQQDIHQTCKVCSVCGPCRHGVNETAVAQHGKA